MVVVNVVTSSCNGSVECVIDLTVTMGINGSRYLVINKCVFFSF